VINQRHTIRQGAQKAALTKRNEHRKPVTKTVYDEISAQKLCAGTMSICKSRHTGREGFYIATFQENAIEMCLAYDAAVQDNHLYCIAENETIQDFVW
jgi:hypothetical protein